MSRAEVPLLWKPVAEISGALDTRLAQASNYFRASQLAPKTQTSFVWTALLLLITGSICCLESLDLLSTARFGLPKLRLESTWSCKHFNLYIVHHKTQITTIHTQ
jgi:hypothetical protein